MTSNDDANYITVCNVPGRHDEALAIAERGRTRAFADLLVERQKGNQYSSGNDPYVSVTVEHMVETVNSQRALVLYYSVAGGFLYSWLIAPGTGNCWISIYKQTETEQMSAFQSFAPSRNVTAGIVKFHEVYLGEAGMETSEFQDGGESPQGGTGVGGGHLSLEQYICNAREALGVDSHYSRCLELIIV